MTTIADLQEKILRKCRESMKTKEQFFTEEAGRIGACCTALAKAFDGLGQVAQARRLENGANGQIDRECFIDPRYQLHRQQ